MTTIESASLTVAQLADALQRLIQAGHGDLLVQVLADDMSGGAVRNVEHATHWGPLGGAVALLNVEADQAAPDLMAIALEVDRLAAQGWLANDVSAGGPLFKMVREALERRN
ncbi:hypothetical protein PO002_44925 [Cupriavidus necator]|uniref:hypothetical protein n=1 Tax=Cupriavidus necator TaxID=106590 RepID=UPI0039C1CFAC